MAGESQDSRAEAPDLSGVKDNKVLWDELAHRDALDEVPPYLADQVIKGAETSKQRAADDKFQSVIRELITAETMSSDDQLDATAIFWERAGYELSQLNTRQLSNHKASARLHPAKRIVPIPIDRNPLFRSGLANELAQNLPGLETHPAGKSITMPERRPDRVYADLLEEPEIGQLRGPNDDQGWLMLYMSGNPDEPYVTREPFIDWLIKRGHTASLPHGIAGLHWLYLAIDLAPEPAAPAMSPTEAFKRVGLFDMPEVPIVAHALLATTGLLSKEVEVCLANETLVQVDRKIGENENARPVFAAVVVTDPSQSPNLRLEARTITGAVTFETGMSNRGAKTAI
jgi:hypothetical protein